MVLVAALTELPLRMRTVVVLRYFDDRSVAETAELMGVSEGTVKSTTSKGLARLHALLEESGIAWQPSTQAPIAEVVTDGETVVTWQPPCTLEAGHLVHGTSLEGLGSAGACDGPAAIDPATRTIMWLTGTSEAAQGDDRSVA